MGRPFELTDEEWEVIAPLLRPTNPQRGGRWRDHRQVLNGIVWRVRTGVPAGHKQVAEIVDACPAVIQDTVAAGGEVTIRGWGKWEPLKREARIARNPATQAEVRLPTRRAAKWTMGSDFEEAMTRLPL
ncbi:HU family DNA-binding protein [Nonomuraea aridisoli]